MINLAGLSQKKKQTIRSVLGFAKEHDHDELIKFLVKNKWKRRFGSFKSCFIKNGVVVKFSPFVYGQTECAREYEQWLAVPKSMRKYFAKVYAFKHNILIQEVIPECPKKDMCAQVEDMEREYWPILTDVGHNHGHKDSLVKFFDWVYYRIPIYINTRKRLPGSKRKIV